MTSSLDQMTDAEIVAAVRGAKSSLEEPERPLFHILGQLMIHECLKLNASEGLLSQKGFTVSNELQGDWEVLVRRTDEETHLRNFKKTADSIALTAEVSRATWGVIKELIVEALEEEFKQGIRSGLRQGMAQRAVLERRLSEYIEKLRCEEALRIQAETDARDAINQAAMLELEPCHDSLNEFQRQVGVWGIATFPHSTISSINEHIRREAIELKAASEYWQNSHPKDLDRAYIIVLDEVADIVLLSLHHAHQRGCSLFDVIKAKFDEVQTRQWSEPDAQGVSEHIRKDPHDAL